MGILDRKQRQKEEVRASILDTAWQMVLTEGWPSFSIRKIADAIEYSVPVIYSHFENKDAILLEFNRKGFQLLTESLAQAKTSQSDPADQIRAMGRAYWGFAQVIQRSIVAMVPAGKKPSFDPWLKYQSFWSMLHGLVSIYMTRLSRPE